MYLFLARTKYVHTELHRITTRTKLAAQSSPLYYHIISSNILPISLINPNPPYQVASPEVNSCPNWTGQLATSIYRP
jgi:hypothetical protein